ncbi:hypothetical protein LA303_01720 [Candidatus Sulfidibacterium hydrothermale]|uniref:hypothetical protein n=1 Tax=Candidatus Sulfidibacterium hydrothermale TaxID=2875962 RepID=UPI001F0AAD1F|nr:hypothetical protein [Candidatus Sulfidibacterium hydrothermale]UBM62710.1 hypothetical protein LA303_01720 [Candidatus Sulfidibacterium hydrothermale]
MKRILTYLFATPVLAFGLFTLYLTVSIFFNLFGVREKEGNYVLFVIWANFISSLVYLSAVYGFIKYKKWTSKILLLTVGLLIITFVGFQFYIHSGGIYETRTVKALTVRIVISLVFTLLACVNYRKLRPANKKA